MSDTDRGYCCGRCTALRGGEIFIFDTHGNARPFPRRRKRSAIEAVLAGDRWSWPAVLPRRQDGDGISGGIFNSLEMDGLFKLPAASPSASAAALDNAFALFCTGFFVVVRLSVEGCQEESSSGPPSSLDSAHIGGADGEHEDTSCRLYSRLMGGYVAVPHPGFDSQTLSISLYIYLYISAHFFRCLPRLLL